MSSLVNIDPDGLMHDSSRYPINDRPQVEFDKKRHDEALKHLDSFRENVMKKEHSKEQLAFLTDATLMRYLRARDSNLEAAEKMLEDTLTWRAVNIDCATKKDIDKEATETATEKKACCQACVADPRSHSFFQLFTDTSGRKVMYSSAARASNKNIEDNMNHMACEMEMMFGGSNGDPGKLVWLVDMNGFG
jgi:hypothetical protein